MTELDDDSEESGSGGSTVESVRAKVHRRLAVAGRARGVTGRGSIPRAGSTDPDCTFPIFRALNTTDVAYEKLHGPNPARGPGEEQQQAVLR
nr:hypothetical protein StreXyl84_65400 [Streptomyces sp. Xyl84]